MKFRTLIAGLLIISTSVKAQQFPEIDPKWDLYYRMNPSGIDSKYTASDFIDKIDLVGFVPVRKEFGKDILTFKKVLLGTGLDDLKQMSIDGNYYSRTYKHDDYFSLYNLSYRKIEKDTWDRICPYLIPLMKLDGLIK